MNSDIQGEIVIGKKSTPSKDKIKDPKTYSQVMRELHSSNGIFSAFMVRPKGISVEIQDEKEQLLLIVRRHFITNISWILICLFMFLMPYLFETLPMITMLPERFQTATRMLWGLLIVTIAFEGLLSWYFDVFVVTDERVIDIDFRNLIYKNISSAQIEDIQDVTYNISGAIPSLLNFGTVLIQTASEIPMVEIKNTPQPARVAKLINELIMEEEQEKIEGRVR